MELLKKVFPFDKIKTNNILGHWVSVCISLTFGLFGKRIDQIITKKKNEKKDRTFVKEIHFRKSYSKYV